MEGIYVDLRITANSYIELEEFMNILRKIQYCGDVGMNRLLPIQIDGDGSGQIDIELHTNEVIDSELKNIRDLSTLDVDELLKVCNGSDFKTHYIGE